MSKIAIVGDTHWGVRRASDTFANHQIDFVDNQLIPYLLKHDIKHVIQLGDLVEDRPIMHSKTMQLVQEKWFDAFEKHSITLHQMIGNHDVTYKNTNELNWVQLLLERSTYEHIIYYDKFTTIDLHDTKIDIIPWITSDNHDSILGDIKKSKSDYLMGHLELSGFEMSRGHINKDGMSPKHFKDYKKVFSGHYHLKSSKGNIEYIGTPVELDWGDVDSQKGFVVLDLETHDYEFVPNTNKLFVKFNYDDDFDVAQHDFDQYEGKFVKVEIESRKDDVKYESFLARLNEVDVVNSTTIDATNKEKISVSADEFEAEDTQSLLTKYVDVNTPETMNKENIHKHVTEVYQEAKAVMKSLT